MIRKVDGEDTLAQHIPTDQDLKRIISPVKLHHGQGVDPGHQTPKGQLKVNEIFIDCRRPAAECMRAFPVGLSARVVASLESMHVLAAPVSTSPLPATPGWAGGGTVVDLLLHGNTLVSRRMPMEG